MLNSLSEKIADFLLDKNDDYPREVYTYGMELIISSLVEFLILIIIGGLLGKLIETLVFVVIFSLLRFFTGGYHANTYLRCGVVTVITFLFVLICEELLLMCMLEVILCICFITFIFSLYIISKYSPIENENKELYNTKRLKIMAIFIYLLEVFVFVVVYKLFKSNQALIFIPTILSVDILMLVEIIRKRGAKYEKFNEKHIKENVR